MENKPLKIWEPRAEETKPKIPQRYLSLRNELSGKITVRIVNEEGQSMPGGALVNIDVLTGAVQRVGAASPHLGLDLESGRVKDIT